MPLSRYGSGCRDLLYECVPLGEITAELPGSPGGTCIPACSIFSQRPLHYSYHSSFLCLARVLTVEGGNSVGGLNELLHFWHTLIAVNISKFYQLLLLCCLHLYFESLSFCLPPCYILFPISCVFPIGHNLYPWLSFPYSFKPLSAFLKETNVFLPQLQTCICVL